jgi:hypothetical protein
VRSVRPLGSVPDEYIHYKYANALCTGQVSATSGPYARFGVGIAGNRVSPDSAEGVLTPLPANPRI